MLAFAYPNEIGVGKVSSGSSTFIVGKSIVIAKRPPRCNRPRSPPLLSFRELKPPTFRCFKTAYP